MFITTAFNMWFSHLALIAALSAIGSVVGVPVAEDSVNSELTARNIAKNMIRHVDGIWSVEPNLTLNPSVIAERDLLKRAGEDYCSSATFISETGGGSAWVSILSPAAEFPTDSIVP